MFTPKGLDGLFFTILVMEEFCLAITGFTRHGGGAALGVWTVSFCLYCTGTDTL